MFLFQKFGFVARACIGGIKCNMILIHFSNNNCQTMSSLAVCMFTITARHSTARINTSVTGRPDKNCGNLVVRDDS